MILRDRPADDSVLSRIAIKRRIARLYRLLATPHIRRVVLLYHAVGDSPWALPRVRFAKQIEMLTMVADASTVAALLKSRLRPKRLQVAVTFDDGYASLADAARSIVKSAGWRPEVFINTGWIGSRERRMSDPSLGHYPGEHFLSWVDVEGLVADGWTVGSHGVNHVDLTLMRQEEIDIELMRSRWTIEHRLGQPCDAFAYTWGRHEALVRDRVLAAGYHYACTGRHAPVTEKTRPFEVPRINIDTAYDFDDFLAVLRGDWDYLQWLQRLRA